jgi:hypothetical protein
VPKAIGTQTSCYNRINRKDTKNPKELSDFVSFVALAKEGAFVAVPSVALAEDGEDRFIDTRDVGRPAEFSMVMVLYIKQLLPC